MTKDGNQEWQSPSHLLSPKTASLPANIATS